MSGVGLDALAAERKEVAALVRADLVCAVCQTPLQAHLF
jgi:hypothetical protein